MNTRKEINDKVLEIIIKETNHTTLTLEEELDLTSIQILMVLSSFERTFEVEIEDEYIFSGMFSSPIKIGKYIFKQLELLR